MITKEQQAILDQAADILSNALKNDGVNFTSPRKVAQFCQIKIACLEHEVFGVLFLNAQNQLIKFETMFRGTINGASVYPREVAKAALLTNSEAVIFTHNHPGGVAEPSQPDLRITKQLVQVLTLIDVRVLDHMVVTTTAYYSFAEHGLL